MMWAWLIGAVIQRNEPRAEWQLLLVVFGWWSGHLQSVEGDDSVGFLKTNQCEWLQWDREVWFLAATWAGDGEMLPHFTPLPAMCDRASRGKPCPGKSCKSQESCSYARPPVQWLWWLWSPCWAELLAQMSVPLVLMCPDGPQGLHFTAPLPSSNYTHEHSHALTGAH